MDKIAIVGGGVTGNVGSCKIETSSRSITAYSIETTAINSCNGEIIGRDEYFDFGFAVLILALLVPFVLFCWIGQSLSSLNTK